MRSFLRSLLACSILLAGAPAAFAQLNSLYTSSVSTRTFNLITGGQLLASAVFDDDVITANVPAFFFNGSYYTTMYVSTNGFVTVGSAASATNYTPISSTATYQGAISPFGANLKNATSGTPEIRVEVVTNRLVVQWRDVARTGGGSERFSFQTTIDLSSGVIIHQYGPVTTMNSATTQQPQVGLRGTSNSFPTQVKNYLVGSGSETWLAPLAGTANTSAMRFTTTAPAKGPLGNEAYNFAPGCLSPTATSSVVINCANNSYTVNVTITGLGTAAAANITATPGGTLYSNVGPGTYVCGPFTIGSSVTLRAVHTTNANCSNVVGVYNPTPTCITVNNGECAPEPFTITIPDNGCATGSILQATIPISGMGTTLGALPGQVLLQAVELIVAHTYRGDLEMRLTSPSGQTRDLLVNAPTPEAEGSNFGNPGGCPGLVLQLRDDAAQPISAISPTTNNVTGAFQPQQPLSGFTGDPNGNWVLNICDGSSEDAGTLRYVRLRLLPVDCAGIPNGTTGPGSPCNDQNPNTTGDTYNASCVCVGVPTSGVSLSVKGFLEGPYNAATGLMSDGLRTGSWIPTLEPYTSLGFTQVGGGGETTTPAVLAVSGNDAVVDWVEIELRNAANNTQITRTRCALIQRDGDVVDVNGTSTALTLPVAAGNYYVALRHRNHLGVMTSTAIALSSSNTVVDFRSLATGTFGTEARKSITGTFPTQALWTGNALRDNSLRYTGLNNDRDPILVAVGSTTPNNQAAGYLQVDVTMDGLARYTGLGNDRDPILVNVGSTTPNNVRVEQLP